MFIRSTKVRSSSGQVHEYVRIVESVRENGRPRQKVIANLGRRDVLEEMLPKLVRFLKGESDEDVVGVGGEQEVEVLEALTWGPMLVARALFDELQLGEILERVGGDSEAAEAGRDVPADWVSRALVLIAAQLIRPASEHDLASWLASSLVIDRQGRRYLPHWQQHGRVKVSFAQLQRWYRTLDQLHRHKSAIEMALFDRLKDLFSLEPELVFYDVTSTYFEGAGPEKAAHGYSRDGKPRCPQVIVGVVMVNGWPIAHHVWEGNRCDSTTLPQVLEDLAKRFGFRRVVVVGDRGMVSTTNLKQIADHGYSYLLGKRRRHSPEVERLLERVDPGAWEECPMGINAQEAGKRGRRSWVQEVASEKPGVRVLVVYSEQRQAYEQQMREKSMARVRKNLERVRERVERGRLRKPEKIGAAVSRVLQRHHGYRYFDWKLEEGKLVFFEHPVHLPREKQYEGRFLIETDESKLTPLEAVEQYKQLSEVERGFASMKHPLGLRPIYHRRQGRVEAHIFVTALAFLCHRLLERRLKQAGSSLSATEAFKGLETIRWASFRVHDEVRHGVTSGDHRARAVLKALTITHHRPPTPVEAPTTRM